ncbi:hypothetical protein ACQBAT_01040 [Ornithinimicrobium sp. Y1847]|uniref:hypothetical protein n=1 Tax=Ornithinimicrobium sp. Y1847 TaxID=3405419 RepID=UPI003B676683
MTGVLRQVGRSVVGAFAVVWEAARLLVAHWPVLVVLLLLGAALRELVLWGSFELSKISPVGATITVALAPLVSVIALIMALRAVLPSMRHVGADEGMSRSRGLAVLTAALVPFLAVYAAQGYLREDARRFLNETAADEMNRTNWFIGETMQDRTWAGAPTVVVVTIVVVALVLRWGLDRSGLARRSVGLGLLAGWVEAVWLLTIAKVVANSWSGAWQWVLDRRGVTWLLDAWAWVVGVLGPLGEALNAAIGWLWGVLGNFDTLVVVPMAWLTVGAVVYGRELAAPAPAPSLAQVEDRMIRSVSDERTRRRLERARARMERARDRARRAQERTSWVPEWLRTWVAGPVTSVTGRFANLGKGLLTLVRAGLVPMVTLCLMFVLATHAGVAGAEVLREIVGPMDPDWGAVVSPWVAMGLNLLGTLLMVVLIAAAVDRFLVGVDREAEADEAEADEADEADGASTP